MAFMHALELILVLPLISGSLEGAGLTIEILGLFTAPGLGMLAVFFSLIIISGALTSTRQGGEKIGGILAVIFSLLMVVGFSGILPVIGGVLGLAGGIAALISAR